MNQLDDLLNYLISTYPLPTSCLIKPVSIGLIHETYLLESDRGPKWIAQGLHPLLSNEDILSDYDAVTTHLAAQGYGGPEMIKTHKGERAGTFDQRRWRLSTYVPGETYIQVHSADMAYMGGRGVAQFHRAIESISYQFRSSHPGHDTLGHLNRLINASRQDQHRQAWSEIKEWGVEIIEALSQTLLPQDLPRCIVHGDPKISNLRFQDERAVMIDLDTCNIHTRLVDLGDAIRSWCHQPQAPIGERFARHLCQALIEGYLSCATPLTELERAWLPRAGRVITLELASRFALDYLEDHYFAYDEDRFTSRRTHNLSRIQQMCQLAREMEDAIPDISQWLKIIEG
jgi:Ser/Thr protein kinase RdoA (MazF antagonist)